MSLLIILSSLLLFFGCATMPEKKELETSLREAAEKYWEVRLKGNLEDIYGMEFKEDLPPMDKYKVTTGLIRKNLITKHRIKDVVVEGKDGTVYVEFHISMPPVPKPFTQTMTDRWVWDREWRHILEPSKKKQKDEKAE